MTYLCVFQEQGMKTLDVHHIIILHCTLVMELTQYVLQKALYNRVYEANQSHMLLITHKDHIQ